MTDLFDAGDSSPSGVASPPVYTTTRLRQVVTAFLAQVRAGVLTLEDAQDKIAAAFDDLEVRQAAAAALRDSEVGAAGEGNVRGGLRGSVPRVGAHLGQTRQHRGSQWTVWLASNEGHAWYRRQVGGAA